MMIRTQNLGENKNQNHADEKSGLLSSTAHTSITDNTDSETSGQASQADGQTSTELDETGVQGVLLLLQVVGNKDGNNETVDTNDTGHNDGNNVCEEEHVSDKRKLRARQEWARLTLDDQVRAQDTHGSDTNTRLGGTVRGTQAGEDDSGGAAHGTEEGLKSMLVGVRDVDVRWMARREWMAGEDKVEAAMPHALVTHGQSTASTQVYVVFDERRVTNRVDGAIKKVVLAMVKF